MGKNKNLLLGILFACVCTYFLVSYFVKKNTVRASGETKPTKALTLRYKQIDTIPTLIRIYTEEVGVREEGGNNRGKRVGEYQAAAGIKQGQPWCAAFVSWCFLEAKIKAPVTGWSPSFFVKKNKIPSSDYIFKRGDIFGVYYSNLKRIGHVGFLDGENENFWITVEGNTNPDKSREGDGVYSFKRHKRTINNFSRYE